tara:strand:- start:395 stop:844 length:450 start_codon:yes stop_codon:yes gene_type:complete
MANGATVSISATVLPDKISKVISGSMILNPTDANHKWYYKLTSVTNSSNDLIGGYYSNYTALADSTVPETVNASDTVAFLLIKNHETARSIYLNIAAGTAAAAAGNIYIGPEETWYARLTTTLVGSIHAISSASTVECTVIAMFDDTSV